MLGNNYDVYTVLHGAGSFSIGFTVVYNSIDTGDLAYAPNQPLGTHRRHAYERAITVVHSAAVTTAYALRPDGRILMFTLENRVWTPDPDISDRLLQLFDGQGSPSGWKYITGRDDVETYGATGKLASIQGVHGNIQTLAYDASDRLTRVESNSGYYLMFTYGPQNRIATMADRANRIWAYRYDTDNNLEYVDNPDGTTRQYYYEDSRFPHALTGITDERGVRYATYAYDDQGRAIMSTHAGNAGRVDITYNADGTRTVTDSRGHVSTYSTTTQLGVVLPTRIDGPACTSCGGP